MNQPSKSDTQSMAEEVKALKTGIKRREEQLFSLEEKLDAAVDALGLDIDSVALPENMGAILSQMPQEEIMPEPEQQPVEENVESHTDLRVHPEPQHPVPIQSQQLIRDPAVIELLNQSAGMAKRQEHTRVSVENLDKKMDALARELHQWRAEDDRRFAQEKSADRLFMGMSLVEVKRLVGMGVFFLVIALIWHLIVN